MAAYVFDKILSQGVRSGQIPARTTAARRWFRNTAKTVSTSPSAVLKGDKDRLRNKAYPGIMYSFYYDPKHKETLPYYDRFPLVIPIGPAAGGFLGINFHYLPLPLRAKLMDALYDVVNNQKFDESTRIAASYDLLKGAAKFAPFKPCVKHYLTQHVRSRYLRIEPAEWDIALFLPTEDFAKASKSKVWRDSRKMI
jgi:hypothetical protein